MKGPTIKQALVLKLSIIGIFMIGLSYISLSTISTLSANTEQIGTFWMQRLVTAREIKGNFLKLKLVYAQYLLDDSADEQNVGKQKIDAAVAAVDRVVTVYEKGVRTERGRALINQIKPELAKYQELAGRMIVLQNGGRASEAHQFYKGEMEPQAERVNKGVAELVEFILNQAEGFVAASDASAKSAFALTAAIAALAVLVAAAGIVFAISGIANPIRRIAAAMKQMSGDVAMSAGASTSLATLSPTAAGSVCWPWSMTSRANAYAWSQTHRCLAHGLPENWTASSPDAAGRRQLSPTTARR